MKHSKRIQTLALLAISVGAHSVSYGEADADIYLNENIGFNVKGFKYEQTQYPCDVDKHLVTQIIKQGQQQKLNVIPTDTKGDIYNKGIPVLAIDINALVLGPEEHNYGSDSHSNLPSVKITSALVEKNLFDGGYVQANHSCAIATLNEFTPSSDVLDMGVNVTVCGAVEKCLMDLSKDVVNWAGSQLK